MPKVVNPGFRRKRKKDSRLPPGQYETKDFPVLSLGPTPQVSRAEWQLKVFGLVEASHLDKQVTETGAGV